MLIQMMLDPMGAQRTRSAGKIHYTPTKYRKWLDDFVKLAVPKDGKMELAMGEAVGVDINFRFAIPKSRRKGKDAYQVSQAHTSKPDADNSAKAVLDGMVKAGLLPDDAQVADLTVRKRWGNEGGISILVYKL